ncbi:hypothetical protein SQW19_16475 [Stenotrophomonas acidaminiphila]|uniref:hypothetical protein n=1 Tax=Stenotrophomonas acidaminiphila TaxID=128780 RepID=UPI002ABE57D7|nr:hypothetical protein [Stenotrophomonas acidaminiphila]WPU55901.1 hypothetical protein SQW19_16475 [Stenotrophomonas acidaminiphila]
MAVARENGSREISVVQLETGKKVIAFQRGLGIGFWKVELTEGGSAQLSASWPFIKRPVIKDIGTVFDDSFTTVR